MDDHENVAGETSPGPGPISRRIEAERGRGQALANIAIGVGWLVLTAFNVMRTPHDWIFWGLAVGGPIVATLAFVQGALALRSRARRIAAFEAEYGPEAGKQPRRDP